MKKKSFKELLASIFQMKQIQKKTWRCESCQHYEYCWRKLNLKNVDRGCMYYEKKEE